MSLPEDAFIDSYFKNQMGRSIGSSPEHFPTEERDRFLKEWRLKALRQSNRNLTTSDQDGAAEVPPLALTREEMVDRFEPQHTLWARTTDVTKYQDRVGQSKVLSNVTGDDKLDWVTKTLDSFRDKNAIKLFILEDGLQDKEGDSESVLNWKKQQREIRAENGNGGELGAARKAYEKQLDQVVTKMWSEQAQTDWEDAKMKWENGNLGEEEKHAERLLLFRETVGQELLKSLSSDAEREAWKEKLDEIKGSVMSSTDCGDCGEEEVKDAQFLATLEKLKKGGNMEEVNILEETYKEYVQREKEANSEPVPSSIVHAAREAYKAKKQAGI